jgi:CheY-like chemotaxis protein/anti-sigma regulatory factor (Ser/Thr protein kinase)
MTTVLVVDDSLVDRRLIIGVLQRSLDCSIVEADSGEAALHQLESLEPDIVLADLQMSGINGLQLVERIREDWPELPVILMTAKGSEDIAAQALKVGAASYVPKKRLNEDLVLTVQRIVSAAQQERTHSRLMHNLSSGELNFELRNDVALIPPLVRTIQEMLRSLPLHDESERLRVGVAVEEAVRNAIYHGNLELGSTLEEGRPRDELVAERLWTPPYCNRCVTVSVCISHEQAAFAIRDQGPGFDSAAFEGDEFDSDAPRGRGIRLMQTFMDSVEFSDDGREVLLRKYRYTEGDIDDASVE